MLTVLMIRFPFPKFLPNARIFNEVIRNLNAFLEEQKLFHQKKYHNRDDAYRLNKQTDRKTNSKPEKYSENICDENNGADINRE